MEVRIEFTETTPLGLQVPDSVALEVAETRAVVKADWESCERRYRRGTAVRGRQQIYTVADLVIVA